MQLYQTIVFSALCAGLGCFALSCAGNQNNDIATCDSVSCPLQSAALTDINTTSQTYEQDVAPEDYVGWVSGWYFGHST